MSVAPGEPYRGEGVNLGHALHLALEDAELRDPDFRARVREEPGKDYEVARLLVETGNSHIHTYKVELKTPGPT